MALVSIIVPSYNSNPYLELCLRSLLSQTKFDDFEIVFVDDGSTDGSCQIAESLLRKKDTLIRHETNQGHIQAINDGFKAASGRYFAHIGADDIWTPSFLSSTVPHLNQNPSVGVVHSSYGLINKKGDITLAKGENIPFTRDRLGDEREQLLFTNYFTAHSALFRREALEGIGGKFNQKFPYAEDWRFWLLIGFQFSYQYLDQVLVYYRVHGNNLHSALVKRKVAEVSEIGILNEFFEHPKLTQRLMSLKRKVYATRYFEHANQYYSVGMYQDCRRCLSLSVKSSLTYLFKFSFWKRLLASFLRVRKTSLHLTS
jgi:glycosyltransferase involved in cell wall biosynthesis